MPLLSKPARDIRAGDIIHAHGFRSRVLRVRQSKEFVTAHGTRIPDVPAVEILYQHTPHASCSYAVVAAGSEIFCFIP